MSLVIDTPESAKVLSKHSALDFNFSMAFQPIVDTRDNSVFAYEALLRGPAGEDARQMMAEVQRDDRYVFDQSCRVRALELAVKLQMPCFLSINFLPNAVGQAATCIRGTLEAARRLNFPASRLIFEITEIEELANTALLNSIIEEYRCQGFKMAIDDFGAGFSGLNLLAKFQPEMIKLDLSLVRDVDKSLVRQAIIKGIVDVCTELNIQAIAEGVESLSELRCLQGMGVYLFQGYLFAKPAFEQLPGVIWPTDS
jgi:EAL domain-containing protein (putative c-di-GMP-specific phosphodiesterase class I)